MLVNEEQYPWDADPPAPGCAAEVRWRTLISADRTPTGGLSMGICEVPPDSEFAPHRHHPQEVYYVTSGEAEIYLDGEWRPLRPATSPISPPMPCMAAATAALSPAALSGCFPPTASTRSSTSKPEVRGTGHVR